MTEASRDLFAGLLTGAVLVLAMGIVVSLRPSPEFVVGIALGMMLAIAGAFLFDAIRDHLPRPAADSGGR